jgi:ABC-type uncharacterized transport system permease subunit
MILGAFAGPHVTFWWIAIGIGLAVTVCVIILLSLLLAFVRDIDRHVTAVEAEIHGTVSHIGASPLLVQTADLIGELATEMERHVALLTPDEARQ